METIKKVKPQHPLLREKIAYIVFWRNSKINNESKIFLPHNTCGMGITISGELQVSYNNVFKKMPSFGTRNILKRPSEVRTIGDFFNISIRLKTPNTISIFTKIPMNEIYQNDFFSFSDIFDSREVNTLVEQIIQKETDEQVQEIIETFFVSKIINNTDPLFNAIIHHVHNTNGNLNIYQIAKQFNISERTINRHFHKYIGTNPNNYINLIRFRSVINVANTSNKILTTALDFGYYDQSHFIKHFKEFTSITPTDFFKNKHKNQLSDFYNI
jgi:AraC-like DNA-binding protein